MRASSLTAAGPEAGTPSVPPHSRACLGADFLQTVLFFFMREFRDLQAAGDESGLGRQLCWETAEEFHSRFLKVNFGSKKHDLGFALMNQLSTSEKRFPKSGHDDIAADYFALRKAYTGTKWAFSEARNSLNAASHCDIAWAGALASYAHSEKPDGLWACVLLEDGSISHSDGHVTPPPTPTPEDEARRLHELMWSDDPRIWRR